MSKITTVIVDDEQVARETLELYLNKYCPEVDVIGFAHDADMAVENIRKLKPELIFLDVELPWGNAFDVLEKVGEINFEIVFITAYEQYAMEALNKDAAHYILKPIDIEHLIKAVEKVKHRINNQKINISPGLSGIPNYSREQTNKFVFPHVNGFDLVEIKNIICCKADNNYTEFTFTDGPVRIISKTLKKIEEQLTDYGFLRVHKKYLVNLNHIVSYKKGKTGSLTMRDGSEISVTTSGKSKLMKMLK
ncbi:MAG: LytTR family DNA-binding domain-containing protein [Bacteroidales bacterium]|nr:LytTR family DNA-binding domain-containing protein [Bacteroidales bacterium]